MAHSSSTRIRRKSLEISLENDDYVSENTKENMSGRISSLNKLQFVQTVEDLMTDDEDDKFHNVTDDEEYFSCTDGNHETEPSFSLNLTQLYDSAHESQCLKILKEKFNQLDLKVTVAEASKIEKATRGQTSNFEWHKFRKGRITASIFRAVCFTNLEKPSLSLLNKICYPEKVEFTSKYTEWGHNHEKQAINEFVNTMTTKHVNFVNRDSGLIILPQYPYFGASPDALCCCDCCGEGCIEVKCPYTLKNGESIEILTTKTNPFLILNNGEYGLKRQHTYYFQIQMQLFLTKSNYCYFVVWSPKTMLQIKVLPDKKFWLTYSEKAERFFKCAILPEMLGRYFTRQKAVETKKSKDSS